MFATTVRFGVPANADWENLRQQAVRSAYESFRMVRGLRSKAFVYSPERGELGGNYVWDTQDDAEAYQRSPAWAALVAALGEPRVERMEICAYVECGDVVYPPMDEVRSSTAATSRAEGQAAH